MQIIPTKPILECRLCRAQGIEQVLDYGLMPMAGGFAPPGDPRLELRAPLRLGWCDVCGLMQTLDSVHPSMIFGEYSYQSSSSPSLLAHFENLATRMQRVLRSIYHDKPIMAVDIGCNDGILLREFERMGWTPVGIDPSDVALRASEENGWMLINDYADRVSVREKGLQGQAHLVTACNVLAHTDDMHRMVDAAESLLAEGGIFVVEVQYQVDLLDKTQFDTVYHEHCSYFNLHNLSNLMEGHGLRIWLAERIPTHSGSIRVMASRVSQANKLLKPDGEMYTYDKMGLSNRINPREFARRSYRARERLRRLFEMFSSDETGDCYGIVAYGAAGRATILMNWCGLGNRQIDAVLDASPLRQGKLVPGVEVPIIPIRPTLDDAPGRVAPKVILVTAWNYIDSIRDQHPHFPGLWVSPLPEVSIF